MAMGFRHYRTIWSLANSVVGFLSSKEYSLQQFQQLRSPSSRLVGALLCLKLLLSACLRGHILAPHLLHTKRAKQAELIVVRTICLEPNLFPRKFMLLAALPVFLYTCHRRTAKENTYELLAIYFSLGQVLEQFHAVMHRHSSFGLLSRLVRRSLPAKI